MRSFYILICIAFLVLSCNSVKRTQKMLSRGDYDQAISLAVKKLQKDKTAKEYDSHIGLLEEAFSKATEENLRRLVILKKESRPTNAREIYYIYLDLRARQELIRPLLPLYSQGMGRKANFDLVDYGNDFLAAKDNYVKSLYREANMYMERNTKLDFRSAYNVLCELDEIQPHYKDVDKLRDQSHSWGTDFVLVNLNNHSNQFIPLRLERELLDFNTYNLDDFWTKYHSRKNNGIQYDLGISLNFRTIQISPERISEKQHTRKTSVKDGFDVKRDRRGNIVKDSLGNPIRIERYKDVSAIITITTQEKEVFVGGTVVYSDLQNGREINSFPVATEFVFQNTFATFKGDERALAAEDRRLLGHGFIPFPNNEQMIFDAGTDIKERFREILSNNTFY